MAIVVCVIVELLNSCSIADRGALSSQKIVFRSASLAREKAALFAVGGIWMDLYKLKPSRFGARRRALLEKERIAAFPIFSMKCPALSFSYGSFLPHV
jgi:hypothetical protein